MKPESELAVAAAGPAFGPKASSQRYGAIIAQASRVQLVAQMTAIIDELLSANRPLPSAQKMTVTRHGQPCSSRFSTSRPKSRGR